MGPIGVYRTVALATIFIISLPGSCEQRPFTDSDLEFLVAVHDELCPTTFRCGNMNVTEKAPDFYFRLGVHPPPVVDGQCCSLCSCNTTTCHQNGSCCPDAFNTIPLVDGSQIMVSCEYPQLRPFIPMAIANAGVAYTMYRKCPASAILNVGSDIIFKCDRSGYYNSLDTKIPVTDIPHMRTFQNRYCALCHGVEEEYMMYWSASVDCIRDVYLPTNIDDVISDVMKTKDCNLIYVAPKIMSQFAQTPICKKLIDSCNVTGHWKKYDAVIDAGCQAYGSKFKDFKNVYCYLCNTDEERVTGQCSSGPGEGVFLSFSALLNFRPDEMKNDQEEEASQNATCGLNQMFDSFKETCRNISCLAPKILRNGSCHSSVETLSGVEYKVFVKFTPRQEISHNDMFDMVFDLENHTEVFLDRLSLYHFLTDFAIFYRLKEAPKGGSIDFFVVYFKIFSNPYSPIYISTVDQILALDGSIQTVVTRHEQNVEFMTELGVFDITGDMDRARLHIGIDNITLGKIFTYPFRPFQFPNHISMTIILTCHIQCPFISIRRNEFIVKDYGWGVTIQELEVNLNRSEYILSEQNDSLLICVDKYQQLLIRIENLIRERMSDYHDSSHDVTVVGVVSLVFTSVSVTFALLTLLTYLLFKTLRTQPGINNMCLLVSLICAQLLFQFGSGQARQISQLACQIIGILVHYTWLMVLFWMNVCSYHMYKVFHKQFVVATSGAFTTLKYCLYCCLLSALPVIINVVIALLDSSGNEIGYGGNLCYLSLQSMIGYVFALPVGLVVLSNLVMFTVVIVKLMRTPKIDEHSSRNRNLFVIYAKISTLTGFTWLFGFLYHLSGYVTLEYIFIVLNGGQGLFVFLSFVCNERTLRLYKDLISSSYEDVTGSSSNHVTDDANHTSKSTLDTAM